jgi:hypothetical protein
MRPGIGQLLLEDNFDDESLWQLSSLQEGSALLGLNEITIAISKKRVYVSSLRAAPQLANFYAEISINPIFCRGLDEYGLLFRAASVQDFYRFGISCDGQVRLDRIFRGGASSPQPWLMSGAVPIGSPSFSRLGVWAVGPEMRFFFNEEFLFAVQDGTIPAGGIGVFARSASDEPLTVNFSELSIWEVTSAP